MKAKVLELNSMGAYVSLENGATMNISIDDLPINCKVGDDVNLFYSAQSGISPNSLSNDRMLNEKLFDYF